MFSAFQHLTLIPHQPLSSLAGARSVGRHDDRTPSLAIRDIDDGRIVVRCHAGCGQAQVIAALRAQGLWDKNGLDHRGPPDLDTLKRTQIR